MVASLMTVALFHQVMYKDFLNWVMTTLLIHQQYKTSQYAIG